MKGVTMEELEEGRRILEGKDEPEEEKEEE